MSTDEKDLIVGRTVRELSDSEIRLKRHRDALLEMVAVLRSAAEALEALYSDNWKLAHLRDRIRFQNIDGERIVTMFNSVRAELEKNKRLREILHLAEIPPEDLR